VGYRGGLIGLINHSWQSAKLSSWYAVGLLARNQGSDADVANKLLANIVTEQFTNTSFVAYGT
jgi:hypothetical protein